MEEAIIIIHPAEIVRRGLVAMLDEQYAVPISCYSNFGEVDVEKYASLDKLLLLVPDSCRFTEAILDLCKKVGDYELVGLMASKHETDCTDTFDHLLPFDVSAERVRKLVTRFFKHSEKEANDELTNREREVLRLIAMGNTNKSIAETLFISTHTVISHRKNITEKLGIKSIPGLTVYAIIQKIVDSSDISPDQLS